MLAPILNNVKKLVDRLTATRAGYLDKLNITGNVADGNDWTAARASKLDTIESKMPTTGTIPNTSDVPSASDYTSTRAGRLDLIYPPPRIKIESGRIPAEEFTVDYTLFYPPSSGTGGHGFITDGRFGVRVVYAFTDVSDTLVNALDVTGSGWLLGAMQVNTSASTSYNANFKVRVDGTFIYDHGYTSLSSSRARVPVGFVYSQSDNSSIYKVPVINVWYPVRFESSLRVLHRAPNVSIQTHVVYLLD